MKIQLYSLLRVQNSLVYLPYLKQNNTVIPINVLRPVHKGTLAILVDTYPLEGDFASLAFLEEEEYNYLFDFWRFLRVFFCGLF